MLSRRSAHHTDPEALALMLREIRPHEAANTFPTPDPLDPAEVNLIAEKSVWGADHLLFQIPSARHSPIRENQIIWGRHLRPRPGVKEQGTVIVLHPWIGPGGLIWLSRFGKPLLRHGIGVVSMEMPHHLHRTAPGNLSGELAICGDLTSMLESALQCVADLRRVVAWLRGRSGGGIGVIGCSLGGWAAAMLAATEPTLRAAVTCVPPADLEQILRSSPLTAGPIRRDLEASRVPPELFAEFSRVASPLSWPAALPPRRLLVVGARHDALIPHSDSERLAAHWGCELWREPDGHITLFARRGFRRRVSQWVAERMGD